MRPIIGKRGVRRASTILADAVPDPRGIVGTAAKAQCNLNQNRGVVEGTMHGGGITRKAGRYKLAQGEKVKAPAKPLKKVPSEGIYSLPAGTKVTSASAKKEPQPPADLQHEARKLWVKSRPDRRHELLNLKSAFSGRK